MSTTLFSLLEGCPLWQPYPIPVATERNPPKQGLSPTLRHFGESLNTTLLKFSNNILDSRRPHSEQLSPRSPRLRVRHSFLHFGQPNPSFWTTLRNWRVYPPLEGCPLGQPYPIPVTTERNPPILDTRLRDFGESLNTTFLKFQTIFWTTRPRRTALHPNHNSETLESH